MADCEYCDRDFSERKELLEHQLDQHGSELTSHEKDDIKGELNKLEQKKKTKKHNRKKMAKLAGASMIVLLAVSAAGFMAYQNADSFAPGTATVNNSNVSVGLGQPVHWHAPYRITVCGEDKVLQGGPHLAHTHGETKFHLEGVRQREEQATLDWIVDQLGGQLEEDSIMGKDSCNGEPAELTVKANGQELENHKDYIVRDGDFIRITLK